MTLIDIQGRFSYFCVKISGTYFLVSDRKSRQSKEGRHCRRPRLTFEGHFSCYTRFRCLYLKIQYRPTYEINYKGRTSYVNIFSFVVLTGMTVI